MLVVTRGNVRNTGMVELVKEEERIGAAEMHCRYFSFLFLVSVPISF